MRAFPALTPDQIRALRMYEWWLIALAADEWLKQRKAEAAKAKPRMRGSRG